MELCVPCLCLKIHALIKYTLRKKISPQIKRKGFNKCKATQNEADKLELDGICRETRSLIKRNKKRLEEYRAEASKWISKDFHKYIENNKKDK